jgi:undecaprenyl diphosphate synthase
MKNISFSSVPTHVAFIMDGNRRWAESQNLSRLDGHKFGEKRIEPLIDAAIEFGIKYLTFWAFSTENWRRTPAEVYYLLQLFRTELAIRVDRFHKKNVKLNVIGDLSRFPADIQKKAKGWMEKTKNNTKITVNMALSYGGRDEIIRAIMKLHGDSQLPIIKDQLTKELFSEYLDTAGQPDPDLLIRTGGEKRLSGFLLWQAEYSELYFTDVLWPDFTPHEFEEALADYASRKRRFGK